jgi:uncharacterized protein (TIRG00374 family)
MDMLTLALILCASLLFISGNADLFEIAAAALLVSLGLIFALAIVYRYDQILVEKFGKRFGALNNSIKAFKDSLKNLSGNSQAVVLSLIISIPVWLFEVASIYFSAKAVNFDLQPALAILSGIIAFIAEAIPTTPAGIGVHEGTIAGILLLFNVNFSTGTSIALVDHFVRGLVIFSLGIVSAIHIGFESRKYFANLKKNEESEKNQN